MITLAGVEHCFMYVVQNGVVDTVIDRPTTSSRSSTSVDKTYKKGSLRWLVRTTTEAGTASRPLGAISVRRSRRADQRARRPTVPCLLAPADATTTYPTTSRACSIAATTPVWRAPRDDALACLARSRRARLAMSAIVKRAPPGPLRAAVRVGREQFEPPATI